MTDLVRHEPAAAGGGPLTESEFDLLVRQARLLAASSMFRDVEQAEQAFAKLLIGRGLGLAPDVALREVHLVEGKPELSANLQAAMLRAWRGPEGERYDYRRLEHTDEACELEFRFRPRPGAEWEVLGTERFTREDAERAGLWGKKGKNGSPGVWQKYPRNMLFARCLSNGVAFYAPEVTLGGRVYSPGEVEPDPRFDAARQSIRAEHREPDPRQVADLPDDAEGEPVDAEIVPDDEDDDPERAAARETASAQATLDEELAQRTTTDRVIDAYNRTGRHAEVLGRALDDVGAGAPTDSLLARVRTLDEDGAGRVIAALEREAT